MNDDTRYSRHGDLARWLEREDDKLDEALGEKKRRIGRLDDIARAIAAAPATSVFESVLLIAAATTAWDEARRLSGMPELCVANQRPSSKHPFPSLGAALAFYSAGRPCAIGVGSLQVPSVPDRKEDLQLRTLYRAWGIETMPIHPTPASLDADPRGVRRYDLWISVELAIHRAKPWEAHNAALTWLLDMHVGREERVPKAQRQGENKGAPHRRSPQYELVRQRVEDTIVNGTRVEGIATRANESPSVVRTATKIARGRIIDELVQAELVPPPERRRRARPVERHSNVFADW
jgi:hypothetical protein